MTAMGSSGPQRQEDEQEVATQSEQAATTSVEQSVGGAEPPNEVVRSGARSARRRGKDLGRFLAKSAAAGGVAGAARYAVDRIAREVFGP